MTSPIIGYIHLYDLLYGSQCWYDYIALLRLIKYLRFRTTPQVSIVHCGLLTFSILFVLCIYFRFDFSLLNNKLFVYIIYKSNTPMTDQLVINYVYFAPNNIDKKNTECETYM